MKLRLSPKSFQVIMIAYFCLCHESSSLAVVELFLVCKFLDCWIIGIERNRFEICFFETRAPTRLAYRSFATPIAQDDRNRTRNLSTTTDRTRFRSNPFASSVIRTIFRVRNDHSQTVRASDSFSLSFFQMLVKLVCAIKYHSAFADIHFAGYRGANVS